MNVGLYFGSFNPIHTGHLIIANHLAHSHGINEVWFVVSPQNPFKKSSTLLNENHRFFMVQEAIEGEKKLKASKVEFGLPKPSYTIDTLTYLKEKYPGHTFHIIMGSDSFQNMAKWKNGDIIARSYPIIIYKRAGFEITNPLNAMITIADTPLIEISSTRIRDMIRSGKSIRYLVPDMVKEEIERNHYYQELKDPAK